MVLTQETKELTNNNAKEISRLEMDKIKMVTKLLNECRPEITLNFLKSSLKTLSKGKPKGKIIFQYNLVDERDMCLKM